MATLLCSTFALYFIIFVCEFWQKYLNPPCCSHLQGQHPVHHGVGEAGEHPDAAAGRGAG